MGMLEFPLYHGTSTIFLESIKKHGLGGRDPIKEWRVLECAKLLLPLAEQYANRSEVIKVHLGTTRAMVAQVNDHINFQHGQVYLSPVESTAVRYATSKKKGSVLVSRVVLLIKELTRLEVKAGPAVQRVKRGVKASEVRFKRLLGLGGVGSPLKDGVQDQFKFG